jgi:hypothetical protein
MANQKITDLTAITGNVVDDSSDEIPIVDSSVDETKRITREELFKSVRHANAYQTRAEAISALPSLPVESYFWVGDLQFEKVSSSSAISDMSNVIPVGDISVKHFGATGDGSTDDTAALQAAIDYMEANNGGKLHWPDGTYKITATLTQTGDRIEHIGGTFSALDADRLDDGFNVLLSGANVVLQWDSGTTGDKMWRISIADETGSGRPAVGNGIDGILLDGQDEATIGLELISQRGGTWHVGAIRCTTSCFSIGVCINGVADDSGVAQAGNSSTNDNTFRLFATNKGVVGNTGETLVCWGTGATYNGNVSLNTFHSCVFFGKSAGHVHFGDTDANHIVACRWNAPFTFHASDTLSGWGISEQKSRHNVVLSCQGRLQSKAATTGSEHAWGNVVYGYSTGNGVQFPIVETGSDMTVHTTGIDQTSRVGGLIYGRSFSGAQVKRTANQVIPTGTATDVTFTASDDDPFDAVNGSFNIAVPENIKFARATFRWGWASDSTGRRVHSILLNGSIEAEDLRLASNQTAGSVTTGIIPVSEGDVFSAQVLQNSGSDLDLTSGRTRLQVEFL